MAKNIPTLDIRPVLLLQPQEPDTWPSDAQVLLGCALWLLFVAMLAWTQCAAVERVPEKVSGTWVFKTTRVPVRAVCENLEDGATVNEFVTWFPGVTREQVEAGLEHAERSLAVT